MPIAQADRPEATVLTQPKSSIGSFRVAVQQLSGDLRCVHAISRAGSSSGCECWGQPQIQSSHRLIDHLEAFLPQRSIAFPRENSAGRYRPRSAGPPPTIRSRTQPRASASLRRGGMTSTSRGTAPTMLRRHGRPPRSAGANRFRLAYALTRPAGHVVAAIRAA
jgi:hypothetical protein